MRGLRVAVETAWMRMWGNRRRSLSWRRMPSMLIAAAVLLSTAGLPASRPCPAKEEEARFGEIHWYQTEKSP